MKKYFKYWPSFLMGMLCSHLGWGGDWYGFILAIIVTIWIIFTDHKPY